MCQAARLLGFAFANADLLFEIDRAGQILFATGATTGLSDYDEGAMVGRPAATLFAPSDGVRFITMANGLNPGGRLGPVQLTLAGGSKAKVAMCNLPPNHGQISCTLAHNNRTGLLGTGGRDKDTKLPDRDSFLSAAAVAAGSSGALALINVPNLPKVCAGMKPEEAKKLMARIGENLQRSGAESVGRLSDTAFGVIAQTGDVAKNLKGTINRAGRDSGVALEIEQILVRLEAQGLTSEQAMLAMRHVVKRFVDGELGKARPGNLADAFKTVMSETMDRAADLNRTLTAGTFSMVFEPVVNLGNGDVSHYEALIRFADNASPAESVCFAEKMGLSSTLDLAVASRVFAMVEKASKGQPPVAMNVSAATIATPSAFALLYGVLERKRAVARRVKIEITETTDVGDLAAANAAVQKIRKLGYAVGLDDFGAGSASLQYLHAFEVDFIKIDGSLIKRLGSSKRDDALLRSIQATCTELGIDTIAEWIADEAKLKAAREIGFGFGQGRQFGPPLKSIPVPTAAPAPVTAHRQGYSTTWA